MHRSLATSRHGGLGSRVAAAAPPTLVLGESNDRIVVAHICRACSAALRPLWSSNGVEFAVACNCSGWPVAFFAHPGVSRDPPYWMAMERKRSKNYRPGVPLDFTELLPQLAARFSSAFGQPAKVVIAHSASWGSARACQMRMSGEEHFIREWAANTTALVGELRRHFAPPAMVLWRSPNLLARPVEPLECARNTGGTEAVCAEGGRMYACREVWRYHNSLLNRTLGLMRALGVPLLRWDRFVEPGGQAAEQIHPPRSFHAAWASFLINILHAHLAGGRLGDTGARSVPSPAKGGKPCPRVFVYDLALGGARPTTLTWSRAFTQHNQLYFEQYSLHDQLAYRVLNGAAECRTTDPEQADLFLVPLMTGAAHAHAGVQRMCARPEIKALSICGSENATGCPLPHFSKATASRHLFLLSREHVIRGACKHRGMMSSIPDDCPASCQGWWANPVGALRNAIRVATSEMHPAVPQSGFPSAYPRLFAVPFPPSVHVSAQMREMPWEGTAPRPLLMLFTGTTNHGDEVTRTKIRAQCKSYRDDRVCRAVSVFHRYDARYDALKRSAVFCLEPVGDTPYRKSYADSVVAGCVPVTFHEATADAYEWLWEGGQPGRLAIDRAAFLNGTVDLKRHLEALPPAQVRRLQQAVRRSARRFQVSASHDASDLVGAILRRAAAEAA